MAVIEFPLSTAAPYRLDLTARVIKRRPENLLDDWDGVEYTRVFTFDDPGRPVFVRVRQSGPVDEPTLDVRADADADQSRLMAVLRRALSLDVDLGGFYSLCAIDPKLSELAEPYRGMRPPRFPTLFEAIVCAVACQQVTLNFGMTLVSRLSARYGGEFQRRPVFPDAEILAGVDPADLRLLAFSTAKARAIVDAARELVSGSLREEDIDAMSNEQAIERLCRMRGIGRWTAEYILLRGLGRLDCFPADDAGGRNNLAHWLGVDRKLSYDEIKETLAPWSTYEGLIFFLLMLRRRDLGGPRPTECFGTDGTGAASHAHPGL